MEYRKKPKPNYNTFTALIIILIMAFAYCFVGVSLSWFEDKSTTSSPDTTVMVIGKIALDVTYNFGFRNLALAPDTTYIEDIEGNKFETYLKTSASHNIDGAYVRILCEIDGGKDASGNTISRPEVTLHFASGKLISSAPSTYSSTYQNKWFLGDDGYYYYIGCLDDVGTQFNDGYYVDNTLTNLVKGSPVSIRITIEAIQRQYGASSAEWTSSPDLFKSFVTYDENLKHDSSDYV